jgi:hypothetical protein
MFQSFAKVWRQGSIGSLLIQKRIQQGNANMAKLLIELAATLLFVKVYFWIINN